MIKSYHFKTVHNRWLDCMQDVKYGVLANHNRDSREYAFHVYVYRPSVYHPSAGIEASISLYVHETDPNWMIDVGYAFLKSQAAHQSLLRRPLGRVDLMAGTTDTWILSPNR
jgi:hypothetical protein